MISGRTWLGDVEGATSLVPGPNRRGTQAAAQPYRTLTRHR
jgi:hypothetical protein